MDFTRLGPTLNVNLSAKTLIVAAKNVGQGVMAALATHAIP